MALFCSPSNPQNVYHQVHLNFMIPRPFSPKISISATPIFEISRNSITAPAKLINTIILKHECCSSLSSSVELDNDAPSTSIVFVKGLAKSTSEGALKVGFSQHGEVSKVKVILDKKTKQSLGFAYVWFTREEFARTAVEEMNGKFFEGKFIHVTIAKPGSCKPRAKPTECKFLVISKVPKVSQRSAALGNQHYLRDKIEPN